MRNSMALLFIVRLTNFYSRHYVLNAIIILQLHNVSSRLSNEDKRGVKVNLATRFTERCTFFVLPQYSLYRSPLETLFHRRATAT